MKYIFRLEKDEIYDFITRKSESEVEETTEKDKKKEEKIDIIEEELKKITVSDKSVEEEQKPIQGFKNSRYNTKIYMLSGDLEKISQKKKFYLI